MMNNEVDAELRPFLPTIMASRPRPFTLEVLPAIRELAAQGTVTDEELSRGGAVAFERRVIPGGITVLILRPAGQDGPLPGMVYLHGGGMMIGDESSDADQLLDWVEQVGMVIVSVRYRRAPEHPYPRPVEDCHAALLWAVAESAELRMDGRLFVAGVSAGGGLAAATALLNRDRGGPALAGQILICPMLDDRNVAEPQEAPLPWATWGRASNRTGWTALLGDARGGPEVPSYAAPARATDLAGLPPAYLDVGSADIFREEDIDYARRIWAAGGTAELHVWAGGFHGFEVRVPGAAVSVAARQARVDWLRRALRTTAENSIGE
jgi:acetyl esterase/lipase